MTTLKKLLMVVLVLLLASCATPPATPDVKVKGYAPVSGKLPLKVALIISEHLRQYAIETTVIAKCLRDNVAPQQTGSHVTTDKMYAKNNIGLGTESLFVQGLPYLLDAVVVYRGITEIKNIKDFDLILYPAIEIKTSYDKEGALERELPNPFYMSQKGFFQIFVEGKLRLKAADVKSGLTYNYAEDFNGIGWARNEHCSRERMDNIKDYVLGGDYNELIELVLTKNLPVLLQKVETGLLSLAKTKSEERTLLAKTKAEELALPSDLALNVNFSDRSGFFPNNSLDAGEDAEIVVIVKNTGKGAGYGTNLEIISDNPKINFDRNTVNVGDIPSNETKEIKIPLKAGLDIADGKASFQFNLKEKRGYDAKRVVMYVPTARLERPALEIASTEINDGDTGLAKGNGNGIPESGETIELTVFVKNQGAGKAIGVNLNGEGITSGIQWVRDSILIGTIPQGEVAKAKIAFTIPRNFDAKEIATTLKVAETRGVGNIEKRVALSYAKKSPNIQYSYRIYSKGKEVSTITNGEDHEIELSLTNSGQIPAKGVVITINPPIPPLTKEGEGGLSLSRTKIDVGEIKERTSIAGQGIAFSIPRQFAEKEASLNIKITQSDFPSLDSPIRIPVDVKSPMLKYTANLLSRGGGNSLEQGEQAILEIQVLNEGNLSAEGVKIKIESRDENLKITGQTEGLIGKIPANSKGETIKFQLFAMRKIKVGDTVLGINITQNEFQSVVSQYALNIKEEGAIVVDVAAEDKVKTAGAKTQSGPSINLKTSQLAETTADESYRLAFEVIDSRNIETIKVAVNGVVIPLDEKAGLTLQASKKKEIVKNISLNEGENKIVITVRNSDNISSSKVLTVTRIGEEDVDTPPLTNMRNPDAVAVVIGISKFENKDITPVDYARRDAMTMKEYLIKTLGFDEKNITEFYDEKATSKKLEIFFNTTIKNKVKQGISDVFIFYSGHGVPDTNSNEAYFAPYDLDVTDVKTSGYKVTELYNKLETVKARSVTVAIDACYSGFSGGDKPQPIIKSASPLVMTVENPLFTMKNGVVFTASTGKQIASWYHKKQHGIFTYYFLQGLRGRADTDKDGQISVRELEGYLVKSVKEQASILYNREQTPEVMGDTDRVLVRFK